MTVLKLNKRKKASNLLLVFALACLWCIGANSPNIDTPKVRQDISTKQAVQGVKSD